MTEHRVAGLYALALVPVGGVALAVSGWVMDLSTHQAPGLPSGVDGWALNLLPASAVGLLGYLALARFVGDGCPGGHWLRGHTRRSAALYLVALGLGVLLLHDGRSPDFWSLGQLVLWVWLAAVGGIVADGLIVLHRRRGATTSA
ncbi:MAG: hypothetical protein ACREOC_06420 [Gemmatimonadales bacterium]